MRVQWAVLARFAEDHGGLVSISSAGLDLFGVSQLPAVIQFFMVANFRYHEAEAGQEHSVVMEVRDSRLQTVGEPVRFPVTPRPGPNHIPGWEGAFNVISPTTLEVQEAGAHSLTISIEGEGRPWDLPFMVFEGGIPPH